MSLDNAMLCFTCANHPSLLKKYMWRRPEHLTYSQPTSNRFSPIRIHITFIKRGSRGPAYLEANVQHIGVRFHVHVDSQVFCGGNTFPHLSSPVMHNKTRSKQIKHHLNG